MRLHTFLLLGAFIFLCGPVNTFDLYKYVFLGTDWMCAAVQQDEKYYLGYLVLGELTFLKDEKVQLNYKNDSPNPLINRKVKYLDALYNKPVVIFEDEPSTIYCVLALAGDGLPMRIISSPAFTVTQAGKQVPAEIMQWTKNVFVKEEDEKEFWYYLALKPQGGKWGDEGSALVAVKLTYELIDDEESNEDQEESSKNNNEEKTQKKKRQFYFKVMDTIDFQQLCKVASIEGSKEYQTDLGVLYWDEIFTRMYIGFSFSDSVRAAQSNASSILIARVVDEKIVFDSVLKASDCKYFAQQSTGQRIDNKELTVTKIQILHSSTGLPYLFVSGTYNQRPYIISFPLVNSSYIAYEGLAKSTSHGKIASTSKKPIDHFYRNGGRFKGKTLHDEVDDDVKQFSPRSVCIDMSPISSLINVWTMQDSLYILHGSKEKSSGVMYAHAIFNEDGYITGWTALQPVPGSKADVNDFLVLSADMYYLFFEKSDQQDLKLRKTGWNFYGRRQSNEKDCYDRIQQELPLEQGGIQGLWFFKLRQPYKSRPLLVAGGKQKLVLALLDEKEQVMIMNGTDVADLSIITAACLISDANASKLIVGGVDGVSQLHDPYGNGWKHMEENVVETIKNYQLTKIGDQKFVKKLMADESHLYILTRNKLEACDIACLMGSTTDQQVSFEELAHSSDFEGVFTDIEIYGHMIFLGTTHGIFYKNLKETEQRWHKFPSIPDIKRVQSICLRSSYDATQAQLFVMTLQDDRSAHLFRYHVDLLTSEVKQLIEYGFRNQVMAYASFGGYRTRFATDGAMLITSRGGRAPLIHIMPVFISGKQLPSSKGYLSQIPWTGDNTVTGIVQNTISGSWIAGGDFGIAVFE